MQINSNYQVSNPTFGVLKKTSMNAVQHTFSEITKPPLEKFKEIKDLYDFSDNLYENALEKTSKIGVGFQQMMKEWEDGLKGLVNNVADGHLWRALAYMSIQKEHHAYLPICMEDVVLKTIARLTTILKNNSETFNFHHEYTDDLNVKAWEKFFHTTEKPTGWVKFERGNSQEEIDKTINDIRLASTKTHWCTKTKLFANMCTDNGNFYIYYKDGYPTLGIRTEISKGYLEGKELTYEIKDWYNKADDKNGPFVEDFLKHYPDVVIYENNICMI